MTSALPWQRSGMSSIQPRNALTKNAYRGINIVSLWVAAEVYSYPHALWASYKQWQELGAQVRKGERSSLVVFYKLCGRPTAVRLSEGSAAASPRSIWVYRRFCVVST